MNRIILFTIIFLMVGCKVDNNSVKEIESQSFNDKNKSEVLLEFSNKNNNERNFHEEFSRIDKIGQLLCLGIEESELNDNLKKFIDTYRPGSIILFKRNIKSTTQLKRLNKDIKDYYKERNYIKPFIFIDQEGGKVDRLKDVFSPMNSAYWYSSNQLLERYSEDIIIRMKEFYIDSALGPVLDTNKPNSQGAIGDRSLSDNYEKVSIYGEIIINNLKNNNVLAVAKHYPGHGSTVIDSHNSLPIINKTYEELLETDLKPFLYNLELMDAVMLGHIVVPEVDNLPASLSEIWINKLRNSGFKGMILSDDLTMNALNDFGDIADRFIKFINSGGDIGLICHNLDLLHTIHQKSEHLKDNLVNLSFERIIKIKNEYFKDR